METFTLASIVISGIANLIMGIVILAGAKNKKESLPFALFSFSTFLVGLTEYFIYRSDFAVSVRLSYSLGVLIPTFLLAWVFNFSSATVSFKKTIAIYATGLVFMVLPFIDELIIGNIQKSDVLGFIADNGVLYPLYVGFFIVSYLIVLIKLLRLTKIQDGKKRKQARAISTGFFLYGAIGIFFGLILPAFGYDRLTDLDIPATVVFVGFTTYAIVEYRWMNLKVIMVQLLALFIIGAALFEIFMAEGLGVVIYKSVMFLVFTSLSLLMVRNVMAEIKRKNELQRLSNKLAVANKKLVKLDNEKSEFLSIASHQIRTPLTSVKGFLSLLLEGSYGELATSQTDVLKKIYNSNDRVVNLVEDLLNISRIEAGGMEFKIEKWRLENICQEVIDTLVMKAKDNGLYLRFIKPAMPLPEVMIDGAKVREVISNLVDNAVKYTKSGGVELKLEKINDCIRATITDTGIGIPQTELPYLFAKFSRGKDTGRLNASGTGLGLYVCKQMIEKSGGIIWVESDGDAKGSRFIVELPIKQPDELVNASWGGVWLAVRRMIYRWRSAITSFRRSDVPDFLFTSGIME